MLDSTLRIQTKQQMLEWIEYEKKYYSCSRVAYWFRLGERAILRRHQIYLRKAEYYKNKGSKVMFLFYKVLLTKLQTRYALHIPLNCFAKGLHIVHLGPIVVNSRVSAGENCSLHVNTALVAGGTNDDAPKLGSGIIVGIGAVVLGGVTIANDVAIGANAVVNKSISEENVAAAGVPAHIISHNGSKEWNKKTKMFK